MENARRLLLPDAIGRPAHQGTVLQCPGRRKGQHALGAVGPDVPVAHGLGFGRVVESPPVVNDVKKFE